MLADCKANTLEGVIGWAAGVLHEMMRKLGFVWGNGRAEGVQVYMPQGVVEGFGSLGGRELGRWW